MAEQGNNDGGDALNPSLYNISPILKLFNDEVQKQSSGLQNHKWKVDEEEKQFVATFECLDGDSNTKKWMSIFPAGSKKDARADVALQVLHWLQIDVSKYKKKFSKAPKQNESEPQKSKSRLFKFECLGQHAASRWCLSGDFKDQHFCVEYNHLPDEGYVKHKLVMALLKQLAVVDERALRALMTLEKAPSFVSGFVVDRFEDEVLEFKGGSNENVPQEANAALNSSSDYARELCSFLNEGVDARLLVGVHDKSRVCHGILIADPTEFMQRIEPTIRHHLEPRRPELLKFILHPVSTFNPTSCPQLPPRPDATVGKYCQSIEFDLEALLQQFPSSLNVINRAASNLYVLEVRVFRPIGMKCKEQVLFLCDGAAYHRPTSICQRMGIEELTRRILKQDRLRRENMDIAASGGNRI